MAKEIKLSQGKVTLVDDEDYEWLMLWKWCFCGNGYARRSQNICRTNGKQIQRHILMHRLIIKAENGQITDHINGNTLDNRKENLRICSHKENMRNSQKTRKLSSSLYKGITWRKRQKRWEAHIAHEYLGLYKTEIEAAHAYNEAALKKFGQFARLNII